MTTAYTSLLGLALPTTGELQGTWGDTVNNAITSLLDSAVAGTTTLSTDLDVTLSTTTGAANQARQAILLCSGARTAIRTITAPAQSKIYTVINATTGGYSVKVVGVGPTTGVTVIAGESAQIAWNGSDFIKISNTAGAGVFSSITNTGLTSGRVVYSTTGGLETDSANLLYSGTDLTVYGITVGRGAGAVSTNTAVGASALAANTSGGFNTAFGYQAGYSNTTGGASITAFGYQAGKATTTGFVTAFGFVALAANTSGANNSAFGSLALTSNTAGSYNTGIGDNALYSNTTASNNTAVGYQAGYSNTTGAIDSFGFQALYANTTGLYNAAFGTYALTSNTTGAANIAMGRAALGSNTTGSYNIAIGQTALNANTTASGNTAVGYQAGYTASTQSWNTFLGYQAGYSFNTGGTIGGYNCFVGVQAGYYVTTGLKNTIIGGYTGNQGGLDIRTASNYIVLSDGDGNPNAWLGNKNGVKELRLATATAITNNSIASVSTLYSGAFNISFASAGQGVFELVLGCWLFNAGSYGTTMQVYHIGCWAGYPETAWAPQATLISSNGRNFTGPAPTISVSTSVNGIVTVTITGTGDKYYSWNYRYMGYTQAS